MSLCNPLLHLARPKAVGPQVVELDSNVPDAQGLVDNLVLQDHLDKHVLQVLLLNDIDVKLPTAIENPNVKKNS